jgi:hypothetical protein
MGGAVDAVYIGALWGLLEEFLLDLVIGYGGSKGEGPNSMPSGFPVFTASP